VTNVRRKVGLAIFLGQIANTTVSRKAEIPAASLGPSRVLHVGVPFDEKRGRRDSDGDSESSPYGGDKMKPIMKPKIFSRMREGNFELLVCLHVSKSSPFAYMLANEKFLIGFWFAYM
jgi:hypothetical protein